ncbi:zinc finger MYM-type protein 1-like [Frankliniella occidentalis]|uniref:Zinc finger MYM-type protein 1-like n=1 Tax=Frankliniella occidentalis TaxID=133901 RepID=A0A9C6XBR6_FRAOC|nr:zinc finger MYM-type protein 1-like [Frankliniella occidentalis]
MRVFCAANTTPVTTLLSKEAKEQQLEARKALTAIFKSILFLGRQGLALRGHSSSGGNFEALLKLLSDYVPPLKKFLERKKKFTSHDIQNEMLQIAAHKILRSKLETIRENQTFSLIIDEASDESVKKQLSVSVRTVDEDLVATENFLGLYEVSSTTGEALTKIVEDALLRFQLPISSCRGQCYDAGSNMRGRVKGLQARLKELEPLALYVQCFNHSLNLALQDCAKKVPDAGVKILN